MSLANNTVVREEIIKNLELCEANPEHFLKIYDRGFINLLSEYRVVLDLVDKLDTKYFSKYYLEPLCTYLEDKLNLYGAKIHCGDFRKPKLLLMLSSSAKTVVELDVLNATINSYILSTMEECTKSNLKEIDRISCILSEIRMCILHYDGVLNRHENANFLTKLRNNISDKRRKRLLDVEGSRDKALDMFNSNQESIEKLNQLIARTKKDYSKMEDILTNLAKGLETYGYTLCHIKKYD